MPEKTRKYLTKCNGLIDEAARLEIIKKKVDAPIRKEIPSSLLHENSFELYDPLICVLSFGDGPSKHGELLPAVDLYQVSRFEPMPNLHLGVSKMLHRLTAVMVYSALPTAGRIFNRMNYFLFEVDTFYQMAGINLDFSDSGKDMHLNGWFIKMESSDA